MRRREAERILRSVNPFLTILNAIPFFKFSSEDWERLMDRVEDPPTPEELEECKVARGACLLAPPELPEETRFPVVDMLDRGAKSRYRSSIPGKLGKLKRTRYKHLSIEQMRDRKVIIVVHQAGVERTEHRWQQTAWKVTCQSAIGPEGVRYRVHPPFARLIASNRMDRSPYHTINIEVLGNFEGVEGKGNWYKPERLGYGELGEQQAGALEAEIRYWIDWCHEHGIEVYMIAPHRISGRSSSGKPNRQICCGSGPWRVAEKVSAETQTPIPADDLKLGGLTVDPQWYSELHGHCPKRDAKGNVSRPIEGKAA